MSRTRIIGIGGAFALAAVIGGSIIGTVAANTVPTAGEPAQAAAAPASPAVSPVAAAAGEYCEAYRAAYAKALGVDVADLAPAAAKAAQAVLDAAVSDGHLTQARAERLKTRLAASANGSCAKVVEGLGTSRPTAGAVRDGADAVATTLGVTSTELRAALRSGKDLKAIAAEHGVPYATVTAAALAPVEARLDAAVAAGSLSQARADRILARFEQNLADGRLRNPRPVPSTTPGG